MDRNTEIHTTSLYFYSFDCIQIEALACQQSAFLKPTSNKSRGCGWGGGDKGGLEGIAG